MWRFFLKKYENITFVINVFNKNAYLCILKRTLNHYYGVYSQTNCRVYRWYETASSIVLVNDDLELEQEVKATLIRVKNAYEAVAKLLQLYESMKPKKTGIDPLAFVSPKATLGKDVYVGPFACIGDGAVIGDGTKIYPHVVIGEGVKMGEKCLIYPNVTIYQGCKIGQNVTIHAGSVIGADGFGFAPNVEGYDKIPQIGIVIIEDNVEIGANTCVDRSTMGATVIHKGVRTR